MELHRLEWKFDFNTLLVKVTYLSNWYAITDNYFTGDFKPGAIYIHNATYSDILKVHNLIKSLRQETDLIDDVTSMTDKMFLYMGLVDTPKDEILTDNNEFRNFFTQFLHSPDGFQFRHLFNYPKGETLK